HQRHFSAQTDRLTRLESAAEIFPGLQTPQAQHEPVVYHFDGEQVRARWKQTTVLPSASGAGNLKQVMTTEMSGTFRNGVLKGEQVSELTHIEPPGGYGEDFSGGPVVRMFYKGVIEGRLEPDGRIKAKVTTTPTGVKALTYPGGTNGAPAVYEWIDQPPPETAPGVLEYWIPLPAAGWFNSRYLLASGAETFRLRGALERLDRYMTEAGDNLLTGKYDLARRQLDTVRAEIEALRRAVNEAKGATKITFRGLPSDDAMLRRIRLQFMMGKWKEAYTIVNEALAQVQTELADLRNVLSANVFKSIIKNYISWSNSIPTDVVSGIAGYSAVTGVADLPRGFLGWYEEGRKDAGILNDQFRKKRALEALEQYYEAKREEIIVERQEVADLLKEIEGSPLPGLDGSLQSYFQGLQWAPWQADHRRADALALIEGGPKAPSGSP
ncbi:MAG: hypothetical protein ACOWWM_05815, partial [Desulfobacterales bacterium]